MNWNLAVLAAIFALPLLMFTSGVADAPCRDGIWNAIQKTCIFE
jgi:hypothetical protein